MDQTTTPQSTFLSSFRSISNNHRSYSASDLATASINSRIKRDQDDSADILSTVLSAMTEQITYDDISVAQQRLIDHGRYISADHDPWRAIRDPYTFGEPSKRSIDRFEQRLIDEMRYMVKHYDKRLSEMQTTLDNQSDALLKLASIIDELQTNQSEPLGDLD